MFTHFKSNSRRFKHEILIGKMLVIFMVGIFFTTPSMGQNYTVTVSITVPPPYSPYLADYFAQRNKLMATFFNNSRETLTVYVAGTLSGDNGVMIFTEPGYKMPTPTVLQPGIPFRMTADNIEQVFNGAHLVYQGISKEEILLGNSLPEGDYTICMRVFDYNTNSPVSPEDPKGCSNPFTISDIEPPYILLPACGEQVNAVAPQNFIFSWSKPPGSPANTQYILKVVDVQPDAMNINDAVQSAMYPLFFEKTLNVTTYLMGPADPTMVVGRTYAFYVTAVDPSKKLTFRNKGMSEVCSFLYGVTMTQQDILEGKIELISPKDSVTEVRPTFKWRPVNKLPRDVTYRVTIHRRDVIIPLMNEDYKPEIANKKDTIVLELSGLKEMVLVFPSDAAPLDSAYIYTWQVSVEGFDGSIIAKSSTGVFGVATGMSGGPKSCVCSLTAPITSFSVCQNGSLLIPKPTLITSGCSISDGINRKCRWDNSSSWVSVLDITDLTMDAIWPTPSVNTSVPGVYYITFETKIGTAFCSLAYTITVFPPLTAKIYEWIPGVTGGAILTDICSSGADATLYVPSLPNGYTVDWSWSDNPGALTGSMTTSNPSNNAPILPNCTPGLDKVIRTYHAAIQGSQTWPTDCQPQDVTLTIWCPSFAGLITLASGSHNIISGNSICSHPPINPLNPDYPVNVTLSLNSTVVVGDVISWTKNPGSISTPPSPGALSINDEITQAGDYVYTVTVQNGPSTLGCPNATAQFTVHIQDPLTAIITSLDPAGTSPLWVCPNDAVKLQLNPQLPGTTILWQYLVDCLGPNWINAGSANSQNTNQIGNLGPYPSGIQKLCWRATLTPANPICGPVTSDNFEILLYPPPCVPTINCNSSLPKCRIDAVTLTAVMPTGCTNPPIAYQWYLEGEILAGKTNVQTSATEPGYYTVEVWANGHCNSATSSPIKVTNCEMAPTITGDCNTNGATTITLTANPNSYPNPSPQVTPPCNGPYTYEWTIQGSTTVIGTLQTLSVAPTETETYCVKITDGLLCEAHACHTVKICQ